MGAQLSRSRFRRIMRPMLEVYGIPNCDTVKRARAWLDARQIPYRFHDLKKEGVSAQALARWMQDLGWEALVNRRGTTWRRLDDNLRAKVTDAAGATEVLRQHAALIKRPVVEWSQAPCTTVGFDSTQWLAHMEQ